MSQLPTLLEAAMVIAKMAGERIADCYKGSDTPSVDLKMDKTPVTQVDLMAHESIVSKLGKLTPSYPILSEEDADIPFDERQHWQRYWLVDPLDGTKEFIERTDEFSVNIALIDSHIPILGVIYSPLERVCYWASKGEGAFRQVAGQAVQKMSTRQLVEGAISVTISRRHGQKRILHMLDRMGGGRIMIKGSALKFALVAQGEADLYPRIGPSSEWDSAAGQCIVTEAGGRVVNLQGEELRYNTKASLLNPDFLVIGDPTFDWLSRAKALTTL